MTPEEWPDIKRLLTAGWLGRPESNTLDDGAYRNMLASFEAKDIADAIRSLTSTSQFIPTPAQLANQIRRNERHEPPSMPRYSAAGRAAFKRIGVMPPWAITGRRAEGRPGGFRVFHPDPDTIVVQERRDKDGVFDVVACFGTWDVPDAPVSHESFALGLVRPVIDQKKSHSPEGEPA